MGHVHRAALCAASILGMACGCGSWTAEEDASVPDGSAPPPPIECDTDPSDLECVPPPEIQIDLVEEDRLLVEQAEADIEVHRKGDAILTVTDGDGAPMPGAEVTWEQVRHDFDFGVYLGYGRPVEEVACLFLEAGCQTAYALLDWQRTEPEAGQFPLDQVWEDTGMDVWECLGWNVVVNALVWMNQTILVPGHAYETASQGFGPYLTAHRDHVRRVVSRFGAAVTGWNTINEPLATWTNCFGFSEAQVVQLIEETGAIVAEEDPGAARIVNFASPTGTGYLVDPHALLETLDPTSYDTVGLQLYFNGCLTPEFGCWCQEELTLPEIDALFEAYAAHGKDLYVTEASVPSHVPPYECSTYRGQQWTPDLQAAYLDALLALAFSQPRMRGFLFQDADDAYDPLGYPFVYGGGLLDEGFEPKPSYHVLKHRIRCWTSRGQGQTDSDGQVSFCGFGGDYRVVVFSEQTSMSKTFSVHVEEQQQTAAILAF